MKSGDTRIRTVKESYKRTMLSLINTYYVFPNIYPGKIKTGEGDFDC